MVVGRSSCQDRKHSIRSGNEVVERVTGYRIMPGELPMYYCCSSSRLFLFHVVLHESVGFWQCIAGPRIGGMVFVEVVGTATWFCISGIRHSNIL